MVTDHPTQSVEDETLLSRALVGLDGGQLDAFKAWLGSGLRRGYLMAKRLEIKQLVANDERCHILEERFIKDREASARLEALIRLTESGELDVDVLIQMATGKPVVRKETQMEEGWDGRRQSLGDYHDGELEKKRLERKDAYNEDAIGAFSRRLVAKPSDPDES